MLTRIISLTYLVLMCTSCGSTITNEPKLNGEFIGENYYDANGWFCVEIEPHYRYQVQEKTTNTLSAVSFQSDMGALIRFEIIPIPDDDIDEAKRRFDTHPAFYQDVFFDSYLPGIVTNFPGTTVIHAEIIRENDENQVFFVLDIPGGGILAESCTRNQTDSFRGFLMFLSGNQIVIESFQYCQVSGDMFRRSYHKDDTLLFKNTLRLLQEYKQGYKNLGN